MATHFVDREPLSVLEIADMRPEAWILELAGRQHGVVTSAQLLAAGWSPTVIRGRVRAGWLRRLHHGVYLVGPLAAEHTAAMAAVLATDGIVSSYPAAVLWDLRPPREGPMHVIARGRNQPGLVVHHTALDPRDIIRRHGIPSPPPREPSSTSPPPNPPPSSNEHSTKRASSAASALIPSMSSSAVTRTIEERQH